MLNEIITGLDKVKEKHKKANTNISNILNKLQNNLKDCEKNLKKFLKVKVKKIKKNLIQKF